MSATINKLEEPVYDHRARIKERSRPLQKHNDNQPISVFWEIGDVKAHCLVDSECKGIMISPSFIRAVKIKPFLLDKPIDIQLVVTGSKSIINYGANATIKYNEKELKEYFDIVNIDYNDAILGTLFLRKHKVVIDFINNCLRIKDKIICNQANKYKVEEGNPQKNKKDVSMESIETMTAQRSWSRSLIEKSACTRTGLESFGCTGRLLAGGLEEAPVLDVH